MVRLNVLRFQALLSLRDFAKVRHTVYVVDSILCISLNNRVDDIDIFREL